MPRLQLESVQGPARGSHQGFDGVQQERRRQDDYKALTITLRKGKAIIADSSARLDGLLYIDCSGSRKNIAQATGRR